METPKKEKVARSLFSTPKEEDIEKSDKKEKKAPKTVNKH